MTRRYQCNRCGKEVKDCMATECQPPEWWALRLLLFPELMPPDMRLEFLPHD